MKIKEICEKTGLTDRTVRYYIEEQLITPFYTENYLGRKSFNFSEQDLDKLKSISTLRAFGFSVEEIKQLSSQERGSQQIVEDVKKRTEESLDESQRRLSVLSTLDPLDDADLSKLAKKISSSVKTVKNETTTPNLRKSFLSFIKVCAVFLSVWLPIVASIVLLVLRLSTLHMPILRPTFLVYTLLCFLPSMLTVFVFQKLKGSKKALHTILTVLCVVCLPLGIIFSSNSVIVCHHRYDTYHTISEATCHQHGEVVMKCEECGRFETQKLEKLSHTSALVKGVEPTCTQAGLSDGSICSLCNTVLVEQTTVPPTNSHTPIIDTAVPASCLSTGLSEGSHCSVCKTTLLQQTAIPMTEHTYKRQEIQQTCGVDGYILYTCACGDSYKTNIIPASNEHSFQQRNGLDYICLNCGLEVVSHGNVDRSISGGNNSVKFYITGPESEQPIQRTLVIYGNGDMPDFRGEITPGWLCYYMHEVDTVIIESGITSIGDLAFAEVYGEPYYYYGIKKFIIRSKDIQISATPDGDDHRVSGIKCNITFDY